MAAGKTIGGINVTITASIDKFRKTMTAAQRLLTGFGKSISSVVFSLKGLAVAMATGAFVKFTANAFESIDALAKTADKLNISTQALAGFQEAAEDAGISNETLERSLTMLAKKTGKNADVALFDLADAFTKAGSAQEQLTMATTAFGTRGASMVRLLRGGRAALAEGAADAEKFGTAIDRASARGVERAIMAFGDLKTAIGGVFRNLAVEIAPYIEVLSTKIASFVAEGGRAKAVGGVIADALIGAAKLIADGFQAMFSLLKTVIGDMSTFVANAKGFIAKQTSSPFKLTGGGILGLLGYGGESGGVAAKVGKAGSRQKPWSQTIEEMVGEARKAAASQAATAISSNGTSGLMTRIFERAGKSMMDGFKGMGSGPMAMMMKLYAKSWMFGATHRPGYEAASAAGKSSLSLAESGSADSYRQQAAIRSQNDALKLDKERNGFLKQMLAVLNKLNPLPAANLGG